MTVKTLTGMGLAMVGVAGLALAGISQRYAILPLVVLVVASAGLIISSVVGAIVKRFALARGFGWLAVVSICSFIPILAAQGLQKSATARIATSVVTAIERHRGSHHEYPRSLDDLVPEQFAAVPKTRFGLGGTSFYYNRGTNGFRIGYGLPMGMVATYDSQTRAWTTRD